MKAWEVESASLNNVSGTLKQRQRYASLYPQEVFCQKANLTSFQAGILLPCPTELCDSQSIQTCLFALDLMTSALTGVLLSEDLYTPHTDVANISL